MTVALMNVASLSANRDAERVLLKEIARMNSPAITQLRHQHGIGASRTDGGTTQVAWAIFTACRTSFSQTHHAAVSCATMARSSCASSADIANEKMTGLAQTWLRTPSYARFAIGRYDHGTNGGHRNSENCIKNSNPQACTSSRRPLQLDH